MLCDYLYNYQWLTDPSVVNSWLGLVIQNFSDPCRSVKNNL